jgi:predicted AAA+ superfamily ATPase
MNYYSRQIESGLKRLHSKSRGRIIVLTGARQVGKSTLARRTFPEYPMIDMDSPVERGVYRAMTPEDWIIQYPQVIIDEIQKLPELFETVKACHDRNEATRFILLGSSQFLLQKGVKESLAGRAAIKELYPFSIPELMKESGDGAESRLIKLLYSNDPMESFQNIIPVGAVVGEHFARAKITWNYYLHFGGMPMLLDDEWSDTDREEWLQDYHATFLQRDLADLARLDNLEPFVIAQQSLALRSGQTVNFSDVARDAGISPPTARKFMQYLEISYQAIVLQPWFANHHKRLAKMPKVHFMDPGICRSILKRRGDVSGAEFESAVVSEVYKQTQNAGLCLSMYHLRTLDGREVDLLIERDDGFIAIECKQSDSVHLRDTRHLKKLSSILNKPVLLSLVVSNDPAIRRLSDDPVVWNVPASLLLS